MENIFEKDILDSTSQAFLDYSAYNLQRRAIPDARDGLRWSQRQLLHAQSIAGLDYKHPFKKAQKSVAAGTSFSYCHGDSSAYGILIRMAKPFVYRALLQESHGNYGSQMDSESHAASRYVELRGSELASRMLEDLDKNTVTEWEDTYDMEDKFPRVLPAKGFTNLINGCQSIGSGMNCSIPPTNLREVNNAIITLIRNPAASDDEIICYPDLPTGATILNKSQVRESLLKGEGFACKIRSTIEYDQKTNELIASDVPYQTYTNTICGQLSALIDEDENCGIEDFADYTGKKVDIHIKLKKNANVNKVIKLLYKKTSLQSFLAINMVLLDNGITPRVFGWREALNAYIVHEKIVYTRGFEYDIHKAEERIHILNALLLCAAHINEVVQLIKSAASSADAKQKLIATYELDEVQAKAILDMKLSKLANLEIQKLTSEKMGLETQVSKWHLILENEDLLNEEIIRDLREVADKFGDERRTKILDIENEEDEPVDIKRLSISLTNKGAAFVSEVSTLYTQRRNGIGSKFKLEKDECVIDNIVCDSSDKILFFTNRGHYYHIMGSELNIGSKQYLSTLFGAASEEFKMAAVSKDSDKSYLIFVTKKGIIKKSTLSEYNLKRGGGAQSIKLDNDDEVISILLTGDENIGILSAAGQFIIVTSKDIRATGRVTRGIIGMKLNSGDYVCSARVVSKSTKEIFSISADGYGKRTLYTEFNVTNTNTKGVKIQNADVMRDFYPIIGTDDILISSTVSQIRIKINDIPLLSRGTQGVKLIKLDAPAAIIGISLT